MNEIEIISWLIGNAMAYEWQYTGDAAGNRHCLYCHNENDAWRNQEEHHPGCEYVKMIAAAQELLNRTKEKHNDTLSK